MSSRTARATQRNPVSKNKKQNKTTTTKENGQRSKLSQPVCWRCHSTVSHTLGVLSKRNVLSCTTGCSGSRFLHGWLVLRPVHSAFSLPFSSSLFAEQMIPESILTVTAGLQVVPSRGWTLQMPADVLRQGRSHRLGNELPSHQTQLCRTSSRLPSHKAEYLLRVWLVTVDFFSSLYSEI